MHSCKQVGVALGIRFCPSCDMRKEHLSCGMLYDLCEYAAIFGSLPGSKILRKHTLCLISLDQSFVPLLGELRSMTTKCFSHPLLLFMLSRRKVLIQLFSLQPNKVLHITKTTKGDFQYKFAISTDLCFGKGFFCWWTEPNNITNYNFLYVFKRVNSLAYWENFDRKYVLVQRLSVSLFSSSRDNYFHRIFIFPKPVNHKDNNLTENLKEHEMYTK